ncbi:alkyl hydroperoxide reductase AhpD [Actinorhabdospora filicis]|uniref:Alkyl hydroperoxide reductase AhpD n=1 Tax=Actinorhabdospora filicis TaxID=1785913 RepID=A0A9W6SPF4_9ACTN|nr:carboxymuconolactone decarboxylase family protein [Actinorhabdospora filicis]GLZ79708.1 alkyl hydroperoxide reductase AhpD [Actinorhabdospora filicis]
MSRYRYTTPVPPKSATGLVAEVYRQQARDFGGTPMPLFMALSPAPDLLAAVWSLMRESLLTGPGDAVGKELVAHGVSTANKCAYCMDAHTVLLHANGAGDVAEALAKGRELSPEHKALHDWGLTTSGAFPFPAGEVAGYGGTALAFHIVNRLISSTMDERFLPGGAQRIGVVRKVGGRAFARTVAGRGGPGESIALLQDTGPAPVWAGLAGPGLAALRAITRKVGPLDEPAATLARKAAADPHAVTDADIAAFAGDEGDLLRVLAFGAMSAVDRVEALIAGAFAATR